MIVYCWKEKFAFELCTKQCFCILYYYWLIYHLKLIQPGIVICGAVANIIDWIDLPTTLIVTLALLVSPLTP